MAEKILIIDDDLDTLRLVGMMLQKQGYQITAANNGIQGLNKAEDEDPDLILLDVMMPDMDGYEVARRLRLNPVTRNIPILMFTAKSQIDDKVTGFEAGADDYLTKPTHPTELHSHVKALLARSFKTQTAPLTPPQDKAFVIGVVSARGSIGVSTLALNLGSTLHSELNKRTIVAEMRPGTGTIGRDLGFDAFDGFSNLLRSAPDAITSNAVSDALKEHKSGLKILPASEQPRDYPLSESLPQYKVVFKELLTMPRFLILDFGAGLLRLSQTLLPQCDHIIVPVEAMQNSIAHTKLLIQDILDLGIKKENISVVMNNRAHTDQLLSLSQVEEQLGEKVRVAFSPAPELHASAVSMNTTAVLAQEESITKQQFTNLAGVITKLEAGEG